VPVLQNGANEATITQALRVMRTSEQLEQFDTLLGFFASFMLDSALVQNIMRLDMAILQESPWYQKILSEGKQLGEQRGILAAIELGLELKFGAEALELMESVSQVQDLEKLKTIKNAIKSVNTLDELRQLIYSTSGSYEVHPKS
jgi:predicted transposase YdaD